MQQVLQFVSTDRHTEAIVFYAQELKKGEVYWVCPPASQVAKAMHHLLSQKTRVMDYVSFPEWKPQNYWPIMVQGKEFTESVVAVHYSKPFFKSYNEATTVFKGKTSFWFITVLINTDGLPFPRVETTETTVMGYSQEIVNLL